MPTSELSPRIAGNGWDGLVDTWDARTGALHQTLKGHLSAVVTAAFSPDAETLTTTSQDWPVRIWSAETGQELATFAVSGAAGQARFSVDGNDLYIVRRTEVGSAKQEGPDTLNNATELMAGTAPKSLLGAVT